MFSVIGGREEHTTSKNTLAAPYSQNPWVAVQKSAWMDEAGAEQMWGTYTKRGLLRGDPIVICDGFSAHREWLSLARRPTHNYRGGEVIIGVANATHVWQPVDLGLAKKFEDEYRLLHGMRARELGRLLTVDEAPTKPGTTYRGTS